MKRKKSKNNKKIVGYISAVLAIVSVCMLFLTAVKFTGKLAGSVTEISGFKAIFGYKVTTTLLGKTTTTVFSKFSVLALMTLIMPLAGGILMLSKSKLFNLIGTVAFVFAAVMFFTMVATFTNENNLADAGVILVSASTGSLGIGAILGGVFASLGALSGLYKVFVK